MFLLLMWLMYVNYAVGPVSEALIILAFAAVAGIRHGGIVKKYWDLPILAIVFFAFVVYIGLLIPKSPLPQYSIDELVQSIEVFIIFLFISSFIIDAGKARLWENVFIGVVLSLAIFEFSFFFLWYARWVDITGNLLSMPPIGYRLSGLVLSSPNFTAGTLNLILPLVLVRFVQKKRARMLFGICLILIGVIEYFASSRAGWIAALVAIAVTLLVTYYPELKKNWREIKLSSLSTTRKIVVAFGLLLIPLVTNLFLVQSQNTPGHSGLLSGRDAIWSNAWQIWSKDLWTGRGPGTFPLFYSQISGPGNWLTGHAHNMWLHLGAETGLVGIIIWVVAIVWLTLVGIKAWGRLSMGPRSRAQFASYVGIGAGVLLQQQANYFFTVPLYMIFVSVLVALFSRLVDPPQIKISKKAGYVAFVLLLTAYAGGKIFGSLGGAHLWEALAAHEVRDFNSTAALMCKSANEAPWFTVFSFQCAIAYTDLYYSDGSPINVERAIRRMQDGLGKDPFWPINWSNLGILAWVSDDKVTAMSSMKKAAEAAPGNALLALNYGWMAEELRSDGIALAAYQKAIEADPWLLVSPFFQATQLRKGVLNEDFSFSMGADGLNNLKAYQAIRSGDLVAANLAINAALSINPRNPEALALLGVIEQISGHVDEALRNAKTAVFLSGVVPSEERNPRVYIWAYQVALAQGLPLDAATYVEEALSIWSYKGKYDTSLYSYLVYHRPIQFNGLVLGYRRADIIPEMASAFQWLVDYYRIRGEVTEEAEMRLLLSAEGIDLE